MKGETMRQAVGWVGGLVVLLLAGCAAAPGGVPGTKPAAEVAAVSLRSRVAQLPGAELVAGEPLRLRYGQLFANGAALPLAGGVEQLQPLADFLQQAPGTRWQLRVGGDGELSLAQARLKLLQGYFQRRGLNTDRLQWQAAAEAEAALQLQLAAAN